MRLRPMRKQIRVGYHQFFKPNSNSDLSSSLRQSLASHFTPSLNPFSTLLHHHHGRGHVQRQLYSTTRIPDSPPKQSKPIFRFTINTSSLSTASSDPPSSNSLDSAEPKTSSSSSSSSSSSPLNAVPVVSTITSPHDTSNPIDAGSSIRKPIGLWPGMYHSPATNALWEARSNIFEKLHDPTAQAPSPTQLVAKTPAQSRTSILYKFSSDFTLREQYRNPWNEIRIGKLVEDLDALAGTIAYKHCCSEDGTTRPLLLVTASVDKMVLKKPISIDTDLTIVGAVTWVGRSSMEIQLEVIQSTNDPSDSLALVANFTFVARDSKTGKSALVNQISPETEQEKLLWKEADERNKMRKKKREQKRDFDNQDGNRLNALLAEGRIFLDMPALADRDRILIRDTCLENSFICQPQQRNIHGRIFGGFLMRRAFELAFSTTYSFAGVATLFLEVDHVDFFRPVDVGDFLRLKSCVLYTELQNPAEPLINVEVVAHVTRPELRSSEVSNKFYFTFSVRPEAVKDGLRIRNVVPGTEEEARRMLERMDAESSQASSS
ncbi:Thioesterase domain containing protein [Parasponia andersonii]|uniref:Thioesterase domain containing protein n=1 Tax=Parasponia andersonii TaxID=3476 RepID=A0A2P5BD19_PARAD|nr:Thioesterase domain containing protein [Parasponia andersonii]